MPGEFSRIFYPPHRTLIIPFSFQDDGRKEVELKAGATIKITTNDEFKEKCTADVLWVDYKNITKVK
jgi:hypothetical protein